MTARLVPFVALLAAALVLLTSGAPAVAARSEACVGDVRVITFARFLDGTRITEGTEITDQFASLGIVFHRIDGSGPVVFDTLDHVLTSGPPHYFWGDIEMEFIDGCNPHWVEADIRSTGVGTGASMTYFAGDWLVEKATLETNIGTDQVGRLRLTAPASYGILDKVTFNGGLGAAAAMIGTLRFKCQ